MEFSHKSVLLNEAVSSLNIIPGGTYIDCTAGGGGHSMEIAKQLSTGRLIAIDKDPDAVEFLHRKFSSYGNVTIVHGDFSEIDSILSELNIPYADGILADLGVSSYQLDKAERGFSYHSDAPLDMRMSQQGITAKQVVNTLQKSELINILRQYGEEKFAVRIAQAIVDRREIAPIETTVDLAEIVKNAIPAAARRTGGHPARKTFQAIRIYVNGELDRLDTALDKMFDALAVGGILSIITFHSLEDRMVKQRFASYCKGCTCPPDFPICVCGKTPKGQLPFKFIKPTEEEINENPRSRSATLRSIKKIDR